MTPYENGFGTSNGTTEEKARVTSGVPIGNFMEGTHVVIVPSVKFTFGSFSDRVECGMTKRIEYKATCGRLMGCCGVSPQRG